MALNWLRYTNQGATRSQPIKQELVDALSFLGDMGITMDVFSGGQEESGPHRTGSHRHDLGGAADALFYKDGRQLDWNNPADQPIFSSIVQQAKARGVTGFGAGEGYMRPGSMHIGFGTPGVWGAGGKGANAAGWLEAAYGGGGGNNTLVGSAGGDKLTPQQQWMSGLWQYAQAASQKTGVDPRLIMAQAALETGYGKSAPGNAYFGIKGKGSTNQTLEFIDGKMQPVQADFRAYANPQESFEDYANLLMGQRYAGVRGGKGLEEQIQALGKSGYATDPDYAGKIRAIALGIPEGGFGSGGSGSAFVDASGGAAGGGASPYALKYGEKKKDPKAAFGEALSSAVSGLGGSGQQTPRLYAPTPEASRVDAPVAGIWDPQKQQADRDRLTQIMAALNQGGRTA